MNNDSLKILVLGSNGFIGQNIVEYLTLKNYNVLSPKRHELNLLDTAQVDQFLSQNRPNIVIYSVVNIHSLEENMTTYFNLERCSSKFDKMITIGSGAEYDMKNYKPLMNEEYFSQNIPSDTYGLSKFIISNDIRKKPRNIVNLRVFGIYGKYEDYTRRFISNNISRALCGKKISMNRNMRFDFLYVNDFVEILEQFFTTDAKHRNYNICTGEPVEFIEIANIINDIHENGKGEIIIKQPGFNTEYSGNNSRFLEEFGGFEFTDLKSSIDELYQWYKKSFEIGDFCKKLQG